MNWLFPKTTAIRSYSHCSFTIEATHMRCIDWKTHKNDTQSMPTGIRILRIWRNRAFCRTCTWLTNVQSILYICAVWSATTVFYVYSVCHTSIYKKDTPRRGTTYIEPRNLYVTVLEYASRYDSGTYCICEQRRLRRDCACAQSRLSLRFSHTQ